MCSAADDPSMHDVGRAGWAYHDANGKPLRGPCSDVDCRYMSAPGGEDHEGAHSWQDGTTGYAHDFGEPCTCAECDPDDTITLAVTDPYVLEALRTAHPGASPSEVEWLAEQLRHPE